MSDLSHTLLYDVLGLPVRVLVDDSRVLNAITDCLTAFATQSHATETVPVELKIGRDNCGHGWTVSSEHMAMDCDDVSGLLYCLDKMLSIAVQKRRADLYFLHAAVLSLDGKGIAISGASGAGKSTLAWYLCNSGFTYLSDELAPIDLHTFEVQPYPRALCLKEVTRQLPGLPGRAVHAECTIHVPIDALPRVFSGIGVGLEAIVFLSGQTERRPQLLTQIPESAAAALLYSHGLNQLAHPHDGLRAVVELASRVPCYEISRGEPAHMLEQILGALNNATPSQSTAVTASL